MMIARHRALTLHGLKPCGAKIICVEMMIARHRALTQVRPRESLIHPGFVEMMIARHRALTHQIPRILPQLIECINDDCPS